MKKTKIGLTLFTILFSFIGSNFNENDIANNNINKREHIKSATRYSTDNNDPKYAVELVDDSFFYENTCSKNISGGLYNTGTIKDRAYYSISFLQNSVVNFSITHNSSYPLSYRFYTYDYCEEMSNFPPNDYVRKERTYELYDFYSYGATFSKKLSAGSYFIELINNNDVSNDYVSIDFNIDFSITKVERNNLIDPRLVLNDNINSGVVWINDYIPTGIFKNINIIEKKYSNELTEEEYTRDYSIEKMYRISQGEPICLAHYYINKMDTLISLGNILNGINTIYKEKLSEIDRYTKFKLVSDEFGLKIFKVVANNLIDLFPGGSYILKGLEILKLFSVEILERVFNFSLENLTYSKTYDKGFILGGLISKILETICTKYTELTNEEAKENDNIETFSSGEKYNILKNEYLNTPYSFSLYYKIRKAEVGVADIDSQYYVSFEPSIQKLSNSKKTFDQISDYNRKYDIGYQSYQGNYHVLINSQYIAFPFLSVDVNDYYNLNDNSKQIKNITLNKTNFISGIDENNFISTKFVAPQENDYTFVSRDTYVDYSKIFTLSRNDNLVIKSYDNGLYDIIIHQTVGTKFVIHLKQGEIAYFRIKAFNYSQINEDIKFGIYTSNNVPDAHEHDYKYEWIDNREHSKTCKTCNHTETEGHAVLRGSRTCVKCHGYADIGFVGPKSTSSNNVVKKSLKGSIVLINGIIILNEDDLLDYLNGVLEFYYCDSNILSEV